MKRMWVCEMMERLCEKYVELTPQSLQSIQFMIDQRPNPKLFKQIVISFRSIMRRTLFLLIDKNALETISQKSPEKMLEVWNMIHSLAETIIRLGLNHNNEPVRLHTVRLLETLIISHSQAPQQQLYFVTPHKKVRWCSKADDNFRLDLIPNGHPVLKADEMARKGAAYLGLLLDELMRSDTTHPCVTVILQSLLAITKQRTEFWGRVYGMLASFPESMPDSLSDSQRQSVKFELKAMFLFLLRMPQARMHREIFESVLQQLQCRNDLIQQTIKLAENFKDIDTSTIEAPQRSSKKRSAEEALDRGGALKVRKVQEDGGPRAQQQFLQHPSMAAPVTGAPQVAPIPMAPVQDFTIATPIGRFQPLELADVIINNLLNVNLPPVTVAHGRVDYSILSDTVMRTISTSDIPVQDIQLLQRYLNPVLVTKTEHKEDHPTAEEGAAGVAKGPSSDKQKEKTKTPVSQLVKDFKTKVTILSDEEKSFLADMTWSQVLEAELDAIREGQDTVALRTRILIDMVSSRLSSDAWRGQLLSHLKEKLSSRFHIAMQWLFHEYIRCIEAQGINLENGIPAEDDDNAKNPLHPDSTYMDLFKSLLEHIVEVTEHVVDASDPSYGLFQEFVVEAPVITAKCLSYANKYVLSSKREVPKIKLGLATLRDLILYRESVQEECLSALLEYSVCDHHEARENCVILLRNQLYIFEDLAPAIEEFAYEKLKILKEVVPPPPKKLTFAGEQELLEEEQQRLEPEDHDVETRDPELDLNEPEDAMEETAAADDDAHAQSEEEQSEEEIPTEWTDTFVRQYSLLYVALCTHKHKLISELVNVYVRTTGKDTEEPKVTLLKEMGQLVQKIGESSEDLLEYLRTYHLEPVDNENQLKEKEELARKFVMTLIDACGENLPPQNLILTIKAMFFDRDEDHRNARFLIPIITTLSSDEIVSALPWILLLPKKTINSVLSHTWQFESTSSDPIRPLTLLVELHKVKPKNQAYLSSIVNAILHCLHQKHIFNSEIVSSALSTLIKEEETPKPLMRTILECLITNVQRQYILGPILKTLIQKKHIEEDEILWPGLQRVFMMNLGYQVDELLFLIPKKKIKETLRMPKQQTNGLVLDHVEKYLTRQQHRTNEHLVKAREAVKEVREELTREQEEAAAKEAEIASKDEEGDEEMEDSTKQDQDATAAVNTAEDDNMEE